MGPADRSVAPDAGEVAPAATAGLLVIAGAMMLALCVTAGRYGYHRDELYFIQAGAHPALGYPDQPLLAPFLARAADLIAPGSLLVLRAPSAIACGVTTVVTGLIAREAGGDRRAQLIAAGCWAASLTCLAAGHIIATATYDICFTAIASLVIARLLRTGDDRLWVAAGAVVGFGLLNIPSKSVSTPNTNAPVCQSVTGRLHRHEPGLAAAEVATRKNVGQSCGYPANGPYGEPVGGHRRRRAAVGPDAAGVHADVEPGPGEGRRHDTGAVASSSWEGPQPAH